MYLKYKCSKLNFAFTSGFKEEQKLHTKQTETAQDFVVVFDSRWITVVNRGTDLSGTK